MSADKKNKKSKIISAVGDTIRALTGKRVTLYILLSAVAAGVIGFIFSSLIGDMDSLVAGDGMHFHPELLVSPLTWGTGAVVVALCWLVYAITWGFRPANKNRSGEYMGGSKLTKEELKLWYASFKAQMKEKYDIDLDRKQDLVRVGTATRGGGMREKDEDTHLQFAFMRMDGNRHYLVPEPMPTDKELVDLAILDEKAQPQREAPKGENDPDYLKQYEEKRQKIFRKRDQWIVSNQFVPDPEKDGDLEQIERIRSDVLNGRLFVYAKDGDAEKSFTVYENEAEQLCEGDAIGGGNVKWKPGAVIDRERNFFSTPTDLYQNHLRDPGQIPDDHTRARYEADKKWMDEHFPDMVFLTPEEEKTLKDNAINSLIRREPKPVPAPGIWSWIKRFFGNKQDFDRYDEYRERHAEWRGKVDAWINANEKKNKITDQIDSKLIEEDGRLPDVDDPARKAAIIQNASLVAGAYSTCYSNRVDSLEKIWNAHPQKPEDFDAYQVGMTVRKAVYESVKDIAMHPECYAPNGSLTREGKRYFKQKAELKPKYEEEEIPEEVPEEDPEPEIDSGNVAKENRRRMEEQARGNFLSAFRGMQKECVGQLSNAAANGVPANEVETSFGMLLFLNHVDGVLKNGTDGEKETLYRMNAEALNESFARYMTDPSVADRLSRFGGQNGVPVNELLADGELSALNASSTLPAEEYGEEQLGLLERLGNKFFPGKRVTVDAPEKGGSVLQNARPDVSKPEDPRLSVPQPQIGEIQLNQDH